MNNLLQLGLITAFMVFVLVTFVIVPNRQILRRIVRSRRKGRQVLAQIAADIRRTESREDLARVVRRIQIASAHTRLFVELKTLEIEARQKLEKCA
jgi:hypothetical protein